MTKKQLFLIIGVLVAVLAHGDSGFSLYYCPGTPQKICQLSGEYDNQDVTSEDQRNTNKFTKNQTWSSYGIWGVDGGAPVEHKGKLYFLFGDITEAEDGCPGHAKVESPPPELIARDCLAYTTDTDPEDKDENGKTHGFSLTFLAPDWLDDLNGDQFHPLTIGNFPIIQPPVRQGGMTGPIEGVSSYLNGNMYIYYVTDYNEYTVKEFGKDVTNGYFGRSVLAKSTDDGRTFTYLYDLSNSTIAGGTCKFTTQIMAKVVENTNDTAYNGIRKLLPAEVQNEPVLFIWGAGNPYRKSHVYLAYQLLKDIDQPTFLNLPPPTHYYKGLGADSKPMWGLKESDAVPLFKQMCPVIDDWEHWNKIGDRPGMGEFSVAWNDFLNKWIMLYNIGHPRGINFRVADYPWGPWGPSSQAPNGVVFDPNKDNGFCNFMHKGWNSEVCDYVYDGVSYKDGNEIKCGDPPASRKYEVWGGEYGPFIINRYTKGGVQDQKKWTTIYFIMSTWNPYQKVLMKTTISTCLGGDVSPKNTCGNGVVDLYDILTEIDFILGIQTPTDCQAAKADIVRYGMPPYCYVPDGVIDIFDAMVIIDKALKKPNCIDYCLENDCMAYLDIACTSLSINGKSVTYDGEATPSSGATITRINWDWGDGTSGDQWFKASHTYSTSGTYEVTATAYDSAGLFSSEYLHVTTQ
jgi:hypothetical protein